jgi:hypothetical protein
MTAPTSPHWETISDVQRDAIVQLGPSITRNQMYLAGGTSVAVAQRGAKRDFVDVYALGMGQFSLADMLNAYQKKYSVHDIATLLYSLTYFDDADREPMPTLLWDLTWDACKATIRTWVQQVTR